MKRNMLQFDFRVVGVRALFLFFALFTSIQMFGAGWTPTDAGLVVNLQQGDSILLSVWVDKNGNGIEERGEEFFVTNYNRYQDPDDYFGYTAGSYLKLLPQAADATKPSFMSVWYVGAPLNRLDVGNVIGEGKNKDYNLGGIVYTIWNDGKTLKTNNTRYQFYGEVTGDYSDSYASDVVFVIPTVRGTPTVLTRPGLSSFDPKGTLGKGTAPFDGATGYNSQLGLYYREVYMMEIPRFNNPVSYTNAALVTFNTTLTEKSWSAGKIAKGHAAYAYADNKHDETTRTIFRLYNLSDPINSCSGFFFATDEQDVKRYRTGPKNKDCTSCGWTDSTAARKTYTIDYRYCMEQKGSTNYYQTGYMYVPVPDSTYYYVGYNNDYYAERTGVKMSSPGAYSQFTKIRQLPIFGLSSTFKAPAGAYGRMIADASSTVDNLDVKFEPAGYFLEISTGKHVAMRQTGVHEWTTEEMWTITPAYHALSLQVKLSTQPEFSELDPGAVVTGWSVMMTGSQIKDENGESVLGKSGWARIYTNNSDPNGGITFILADKSKHIHYDNNGFFGMQIPDQYPAVNATTLTVEKGRLKPEYTFTGWNTQPDGSGVTINADDVLTLASLPTGVIWLGDTVINLYAQASYKGTYNVALSFINTADNKRYFLTHPNSSTPRFARARHFDEWTNTWQGMDGAENIDPNYISTFELRHPINEIEKKDGDIPDLTNREYVLDPRHYTTHGVVDSLTFYEFFAPSKDEYLGLYYEDPVNTILANNSWAGLFTTTSNATSTGWPDYREPCISSTKLKSERYVEAYDPDNLPDSLILKVRANSARSFVKYVPATDQFDGVATEGEATDFQISAVIVADERYVVLPDTTKAWRDEIEFGYHQNAQTREEVWSALIGKQLMACMLVGGDTIYFHPNRNKIISDPNNLYLSSDFRITQTFDFIPDSRVSGVSETNLASSEGTSNYWCYNIVSGVSSPMNVKDAGGNYIDIVDTFRITLSQGGISKVKAYYGRWKKQGNDDGLTVNGLSRSRDIIVRTKTYHYSPEVPHLELTPEYSTYEFSPLAGYSKQLNFTLTKVTTRQLLDVNDNPIGEPEVVSTQDVTSYLALSHGACSFTVGSIFNVDRDNTVGNHVTLITDHNNNTPGHNYDTLVINKTIRIDEVDYLATARVPLMQPSLEGNELIWSVVDNNVRYFIMAGNNGETNKLIYRRYSLKNNYLYQLNTSTQLIKGSANAENSDTKYITPWQFTYANQEYTQLTLSIEAPVSLNFVVESETTPNASTASPTALTYEYVNVYVNDNANFEEQVKLRYGANQWLKFSTTGSPHLELTTNSAEASVFSWSYLKRDYYLLNNGKYPNKPYLEFTYNNMVGASVDTKYQGYSEHSMLLGNKITYCITKTQNQVSWLIAKDGDWHTAYSINLIRDSRFANKPSGLRLDTLPNNLSIKVTPTTSSPTSSGNDYKIAGKFENIVDTLDVQISLQDDAPEYRFKDAWKDFKSLEDAHLKIPLIRRTYHIEPYDSLICTVKNDAYNHTFPAALTGGAEDSYTFVLKTDHREGTRVLNVYNEVATSSGTSHDHTDRMDFTSKALTEIRLIDEYGNTPNWCRISGKTKNTITVQCTADGIRSPRTASIYIAYTMKDDNEVWRYINVRLTVSQPSLYQYANNQHLVHSQGASGDPLDGKGMQQVHENRRILYYYPEQDVELPVRESHFFGWWRWFREGEGYIGDSDIPDGDWRTPPRNVDKKYNYPFRRIGNKVPDPDGAEGDSILVTMGRYTVFHYRSKDYTDVRNNPPCKTALVAPPVLEFGVAEKPTVTYAVDMSNYYDKLPMSLKNKNQVDTAKLDTMRAIPEPTLSLREVFELHPWTEMADTMENYKYADNTATGSNSYTEKYMEDHVVMAPIDNRLLLSTEQRYNLTNIQAGKHSESLLGYYMKDDNWSTWSSDPARQDSMIWCAGWDADCQWFTYTPRANSYESCDYSITQGDDFLNVLAHGNLSPAQTADTVYYCLRARSKATTGTPGVNETTVDGGYWFNICRYMVIYHRSDKYGPKLEQNGKAIIDNDEIEQHYEVLERLNFDYNKPGNSYTLYPHPLPWADASYGFTYPETADLPHNRLHSQTDLPNFGEYGLVNRIHYTDYWYDMEQHGGAANGYMIYCDGMSSSGQVAALSLESKLCEGQKMYFSGYVGNPSHQNTEKARPNFLFSVQGSLNGTKWEDITSYMTGEIPASNKWYQILFPIDQRTSYNYFRVRVLNMSSAWDGNDFVIDDMCIFATKPPLIAYQANTTCKNEAENDSLTHVVLRVDYQGFNDDTYNGGDVIYTIQRIQNNTDTTYMRLVDGYFNEQINPHIAPATKDTIYGKVPMPVRTYVPEDPDSIFTNLSDLIQKFEQTLEAGGTIFRQGYIYETLDEDVRPVMYIIHSAKMASDEKYMVRMAGKLKELSSSKCAVTSPLRVKNHMVLELNGEEKDRKEVDGMCANSTYDVSLRVKGSLLLDNSAPIDINGSCVNDWLLYGDTAHAASILRYGYSYRDIVTVIKDILRCEPEGEVQTNTNQFARNLSEVSRNEMIRVKNWKHLTLKDTEDDPYTILSHLVTGGFLTLYRSKLTITTTKDNTVAYVIFPIVGTGSDAMLHRNVEVCPTPVYISLRSNVGGDIPITVGGFNPNARPTDEPATILVTVNNANDEIVVPIDSIMSNVAVNTIDFLSTNDPNYLEGVHTLSLVPDRVYDISSGSDNSGYYKSGHDMILTPAPSNNYQMKPGYNYTFGLTMMTKTGSPTLPGSDCRVGTIPFVVSVVPDYLRWEPKSEDSKAWNNPDNWLGIDEHNVPIHGEAHYAPLSTSKVIIPSVSSGLPYPELPSSITSKDSVKQTGFEYNQCSDIRLLPGAALGNQKYLTYTNAVVDMGTPQKMWALRSAPVTGMLSGDLFMADNDITGRTPAWEVGEFDASGRNYKTGNASFWLSLYNQTIVQKGNNDNVEDTKYTAEAAWSPVTNGMTYSLPPAQGWAVYTNTKSKTDADIRLPKHDDIFYYYYKNGDKAYDQYEQNLQSLRDEYAGGAGKAGKLAFHPATDNQEYTLSNGAESKTFVFGNPALGYIDIWSFVAFNSLKPEIGYMDPKGHYHTVNRETAVATSDVITNEQRYLPPMHAMVISLSDEAAATKSTTVTLKTDHVITKVSVPDPSSAPRRAADNGLKKGIMTVTAVNPCSPRCTSRLLLGQGYHSDIIVGEDALLTTLNIDNYTNNTTPATPFNIYAAEGEYGLCIDLRDEIVEIPLSFSMSDLPYDSITNLWFTGVNNISGSLVLFDSLTMSERPIIDGICLKIETPEFSHEKRYYIRRHGDLPIDPVDPPIATDYQTYGIDEILPVYKFIKDGHVYILRDGHVYTIFGQKIR